MGRGFKTRKIVLGDYGSYLKMDKGCFVVKDTEGKERKYPALEKDLGEITLAEGNVVTTGALVYCGLWCIDIVVTTRFGEPIAMLKNFIDDSYVTTRIGQYESLKNGKAQYLAKQMIIGKIEGQNILLNKYGLRPDHSVSPRINSLKETDLKTLRGRILHLEGMFGHACIHRRDFHPKKVIIGNKKAKRMFLKDEIASDLVDKLHDYFTRRVKIPRIRVGRRQELETLINEEAMLLGKYLRDERKEWIPRIAIP